MLTEQTIKNGIRNIKANLGVLIAVEDVPYIVKAWQRNFNKWTESEFKKVIECFIDNADVYTKFPRPYELKRIYFENITRENDWIKKQEEWEMDLGDSTPMPKETKEKLAGLMGKYEPKGEFKERVKKVFDGD